MSDDKRSHSIGMALMIVGGALLLAALVWMAVIGYYPNQLLIIVVMVAVGAGLAWFGQRIYQNTNRKIASRHIQQRDAGTGRHGNH